MPYGKVSNSGQDFNSYPKAIRGDCFINFPREFFKKLSIAKNWTLLNISLSCVGGPVNLFWSDLKFNKQVHC